MKKMFVLLFVAMICGSQMIFSQNVIVGTVRTDGFQKITKGAFWSKRPESKMIYDGSYPPGFKVYDLESDYFVRFVDEEHNQDDKNYIVFPKGEKVYVDQKGQYFAAICGNKIEFLKPVDMVSITSSSSSNSGSFKKDTTVCVEREKQEVSNGSEKPERAERTNGNTYYINNNTPYGYYGMGYYYGYYGGAYCYRYYDGPSCHYNGGNNHYNGNTGCNNLPTGNNYNYTGSNHNFTGGNNRPTFHGGMSTGRGNGNTNTGGSGNTNNGGRSSVSPYSNSSNVSVGRSNVPSSSISGNGGGGRGNSFSSGGSSSRSSGNRGGGQGGRR